MIALNLLAVPLLKFINTVFIILSLFFFFSNSKAYLAGPEKEESTYSREFWMFVGSLILVMVAALITVDTSWPVINKILGSNRTIIEPVEHYNRYTIWFGIVISLLAALTQYLRYKEHKERMKTKTFLPKTLKAAIAALVLTGLIAYFLELFYVSYIILLFSSLFVILSNTNYIFDVLRGKIKVAGASVSHIGFRIDFIGFSNIYGETKSHFSKQNGNAIFL